MAPVAKTGCYLLCYGMEWGWGPGGDIDGRIHSSVSHYTMKHVVLIAAPIVGCAEMSMMLFSFVTHDIAHCTHLQL